MLELRTIPWSARIGLVLTFLFIFVAVFADLVAEPGVVASLQELGFAEPKFGHGRIISKPPHSPQLYWCAACTQPAASFNR